jgi:lysozyme
MADSWVDFITSLWAPRKPLQAPPVPPAPTPAAPPPAAFSESVDALAADFAAPFEGFVPHPYQDPVGVWTIGYGSTRDKDNKPVTAATPVVTEAQARDLMARDMKSCASEIAVDCKVSLTVDQKVALLDFIYNLGAGNFRSSTLLRKLNAGDYAGAAAEFDNWDHAGGKVLAGLLKRRQAETDLFKKDIQT